MEDLIENKEKAHFLNMVIKKIRKDRLSVNELKTYKDLKNKIDPDNKIEYELTAEWKKAEDHYIAERIKNGNEGFGFSLKKTKHSAVNLMGKILSYFI